MSDLKIVTEPDGSAHADIVRSGLPVPSSEGAFTRRDLDLIKRDLITVRKDYNEIRDNLVILTHQYSSTPSRSFFVSFGIVWLALMAALLIFQPTLTHLSTALIDRVLHR